MFSWRGSAGASGYDVERAPAPDGPWACVAADVSDADAAYRPLFSDTEVRPRERWFYRVRARNRGGVSAPSNVVGPVEITGRCWVEECRDVSGLAERSAGLRVVNEYNGRYAEYLFRLAGTTNDFVVLHVPGRVGRVRMTAFSDPTRPAGDLRLLAAPAGVPWNEAELKRNDRPLPPTPGGAAGQRRRVWHEYAADLPFEASRVRIEWTGPMELDRIELRGR